MKLQTSLLLAFIGIISSASASPAPLPQSSKPGPCIVPQIYYTSLPKAFKLSALLPGPSTSTQQRSTPVQLNPRDPSKTVISDPVISFTKIVPPSFRLVDGALVTDKGSFPAQLSPIIAIFPPPHQPFTFGGKDAGSPAKWGAVYACDNTGTQILKLVPDPSKPIQTLTQCHLHVLLR